MFARQGIPLMFFGIFWTAFSIFWTLAAAGFEVPSFNKGFDFFPLFGIPFVLIGFGLLTAPFWMRVRAGNTAYVLTDKRAIIFSKKGRRFIVKDYLPEELKSVYREESSNGMGSVIFFKAKDTDTLSSEVGFLSITDVKEVEKLVKTLSGRES